MTITTKFNLGDIVYFIFQGTTPRIEVGQVDHINLGRVSESEASEFTYGVRHGVRTTQLERNLFSTKEALLATL